MNEEFGDRIRLARIASHKTSASAFARNVLGINPTELWRYENGHIAPSSRRLEKIAAATNVSIDWLVTGKGKGPSSSPRNEVK